MATAAGLAVTTAILGRNLVERVRTMGALLEDRLGSAFGQHPNVGDIRGRGLFRGLEFVADRETKAPFDPSLNFAGRIKKAAFAEGLICYPMFGTIDGQKGDHLLLAPPFIIEEGQIDELVQKLDTAIGNVVAELHAEGVVQP